MRLRCIKVLILLNSCVKEHCYETQAGSRECKVLKTEDGMVKSSVTR
jgi:hypothetical protein